MHYKVNLIVVSYPKCGTTWMQQIVTLLLNDGHIPNETEADGLFTLSPFMELYGADKAVNMKRPGAIKTHFSFDVQPWNDNAKYIIVLRNPKDAIVSYFHHITSIPAQWQFENATISDFLTHWLAGDVIVTEIFVRFSDARN